MAVLPYTRSVLDIAWHARRSLPQPETLTERPDRDRSWGLVVAKRGQYRTANCGRNKIAMAVPHIAPGKHLRVTIGSMGLSTSKVTAHRKLSRYRRTRPGDNTVWQHSTLHSSRVGPVRNPTMTSYASTGHRVGTAYAATWERSVPSCTLVIDLRQRFLEPAPLRSVPKTPCIKLRSVSTSQGQYQASRSSCDAQYQSRSVPDI